MARPEPSNSKQCAVGTSQVLVGPGILTGLVLSPGSAASTVTVYDNTAGSGTVIMNFAATASGQSVTWGDGSAGIVANTGITVVVAGTGATANVIYANTLG